jgi:hypothetical protein
MNRLDCMTLLPPPPFLMGHLVPQHRLNRENSSGSITLDLLFLCKGTVAPDQYLANIIGVACNSQILHAALKVI